MSISVGNVSNGVDTATATSPFTWTHNHNGDTVVVVLDNANGGGIADPTAVSFGGTAMTKIASVTDTSTIFNSSIWVLTTGSTLQGNETVSVTWTSGGGSIGFPGMTAVSLTGVNQTTPNRTGASASSDANLTASVSPTSSTGDLIIGGVSIYSITYTSGGSQTQLVSLPDINSVTSASTDSAPGGTASLTWTGTTGTNNKWTAVAAAFIAAAVTGDVLQPQACM